MLRVDARGVVNDAEGMKTKLLGLIAYVALLGVSPAAATTYIVRDSVDGLAIFGTITISGPYGVVNLDQISSWNLTISNGSTSVRLTPSDSSTFAPCYFVCDIGAMVDSRSFLSWNYSDPVASYFGFRTTGSGPVTAVLWEDLGRVGTAGSLDLRISGGDYVVPDNKFGYVFYPAIHHDDDSVAVPLHPSIVSELTGLGLLGLVAWRRKRKASVALAAA
jgi:hypothetical protein